MRIIALTPMSLAMRLAAAAENPLRLDVLLPLTGGPFDTKPAATG